MENTLKKRFCGGMTWVELLLVIFVIMLIGAVLFPVLFPEGELSRRNSCTSNLKQLALGMSMYAQDYDQVMPQAKNWNDSIRPYIKSEKVFICPSAKGAKEPTYAMNKQVSGLDLKGISDQDKVIMLFESIPGRNLSGGSELFPKTPLHAGYNNIAFLDGHVIPLKPGGMGAIRWNPR